jgi:hypothetical protein
MGVGWVDQGMIICHPEAQSNSLSLLVLLLQYKYKLKENKRTRLDSPGKIDLRWRNTSCELNPAFRHATLKISTIFCHRRQSLGFLVNVEVAPPEELKTDSFLILSDTYIHFIFLFFFYLHNLSKTKIRNAIYSISKQFVTICYYFKLIQNQIESKKYFQLATLDKDLFFWIDSLFTFKNILISS